LTRRGLEPDAAANHIVSASWLALTLIGAAAGVFALAGGKVVSGVLGHSYAGDVGSEVGRLVVVMSPWMLAAVGVAVTFPLCFVVGRTRALPWVAVGVLVFQVPLAWAGERLLHLDGLAVSLAIATFIVLAVLLGELRVLGTALRGLLVAGAIVGAISVLAFAVPAFGLGAIPSAAVGIALYVGILALVRPSGLRQSWRYLRALS
jgi:hypothetical protein